MKKVNEAKHTPSDTTMEAIAISDALARLWGEDSPLVEKAFRAVNSHEALLEKFGELVRSAENLTGIVRNQMKVESNLQAQCLGHTELLIERAKEFLKAIAQAEGGK